MSKLERLFGGSDHSPLPAKWTTDAILTSHTFPQRTGLVCFWDVLADIAARLSRRPRPELKKKKYLYNGTESTQVGRRAGGQAGKAGRQASVVPPCSTETVSTWGPCPPSIDRLLPHTFQNFQNQLVSVTGVYLCDSVAKRKRNIGSVARRYGYETPGEAIAKWRINVCTRTSPSVSDAGILGHWDAQMTAFGWMKGDPLEDTCGQTFLRFANSCGPQSKTKQRCFVRPYPRQGVLVFLSPPSLCHTSTHLTIGHIGRIEH